MCIGRETANTRSYLSFNVSCLGSNDASFPADETRSMKPFTARILPFTIAVSVFLLVVAGTLWIRPSAAERIKLSEVSHIHGIAVDPSDPSRLFLATHHGLFLTSPDGTASRVSDNANDYMGFTPHPTDSSLLYASGHPAGGGNM